eukprot:2109403-Rhodomonas_salina.2
MQTRVEGSAGALKSLRTQTKKLESQHLTHVESHVIGPRTNLLPVEIRAQTCWGLPVKSVVIGDDTHLREQQAMNIPPEASVVRGSYAIGFPRRK